MLSDFGSAVQGDERRNHDAQPNVYRSPEVMLKTDWSYPVDIWNVGVMVYLPNPLSISIPCTDQLGKQAWDLFEGNRLFYGNDPDGKGYSTRAHLAEVMGILGPPPLDMLQRGKRSNGFFSTDGKSTITIILSLNVFCKGLSRQICREMEARHRHPKRSRLGTVGRAPGGKKQGDVLSLHERNASVAA